MNVSWEVEVTVLLTYGVCDTKHKRMNAINVHYIGHVNTWMGVNTVTSGKEIKEAGSRD